MITLICKWIISAASIFLVGYFVPGIDVIDFKVALAVALVLGVLNITLGNILKLLALPITIITLGLFAFVVNGFIFWLIPKLIEGFIVESFGYAIVGALAVSILSAIINRVFLGSDRKYGGD